MIAAAERTAVIHAPRPRRSLSVNAAVGFLYESLLVNRDIYRSALASTEFSTAAERSDALRTLERERIETENAINLLKLLQSEATA